VLRAPRVLCRAGAERVGPVAVARDSVRGCGRCAGWTGDRRSDLSPARSLLRARDARLSAGAAVRFRVAGVPGARAPAAAPIPRRLYAVRRSQDLCVARGRTDDW